MVMVMVMVMVVVMVVRVRVRGQHSTAGRLHHAGWLTFLILSSSVAFLPYLPTIASS
tara:strand:+ start:307 stop:477 length:171 start_codon:yes stop_codon:yes gene_type:complete